MKILYIYTRCSLVCKVSSKTSIQRFKASENPNTKSIKEKIHRKHLFFVVVFYSVRTYVRTFNINTFNIFPYYLWFRTTSMHMYYLQCFAIRTMYMMRIHIECLYALKDYLSFAIFIYSLCVQFLYFFFYFSRIPVHTLSLLFM